MGGAACASLAALPTPPPSPQGGARRSPIRNMATDVIGARLLRLDRLVAHQVPDFVDLVDEGLGLEKLRVVLVEPGLDDRLDAARPRRHHRHAVGEIDRLLHVVGDEDHGLGRALPDAEELRLHQAARLRIERAERLVHQQDFRIEGERARERGALLHAAGELRGIAVLETLQPDQIDERLRALLALRARQPLPLEAVENVGAHRLPREQREMLEHDAAVGPGPGDRLAVDQDLAGLGREKAADEIEQRRLAAARGAEQRDEFPLAHVERHVVERQHRPAARRPVGVAHALDDDLRHDDINASGYSAAMRCADCDSMSPRHLARLSPSGSTSAAVRALAIASIAWRSGIWPASAGRITCFSICR